MTDIDAPMRYAEPATDRTERDGSVGLGVLLALALATAAVGLPLGSRETGEPAGGALSAIHDYRDLLGHDAAFAVPAPDRAFAGNPHLAEAIFRLARAAQQG